MPSRSRSAPWTQSFREHRDVAGVRDGGDFDFLLSLHLLHVPCFGQPSPVDTALHTFSVSLHLQGLDSCCHLGAKNSNYVPPQVPCPHGVDNRGALVVPDLHQVYMHLRRGEASSSDEKMEEGMGEGGKGRRV